jgi:hypothetical protein
MNTSVTDINLRTNGLRDEGVSRLADALIVNATVTKINLCDNIFGDEGASALAKVMKVNTSVTAINVVSSKQAIRVTQSLLDKLNELVARNQRLRLLFLSDARQMLLSVMCIDEGGVVLSFLPDDSTRADLIAATGNNVDTLRAEFAAVVAERRRRATPFLHLVTAAVDARERDSRAGEAMAVVEERRRARAATAARLVAAAAEERATAARLVAAEAEERADQRRKAADKRESRATKRRRKD